jgi:aspartyl/asparaginyl-tRNA synthetase
LVEEEFAAPQDDSAVSDPDAAVALMETLLDRVADVLRAGIRGALDAGAVEALGVGTEHLVPALGRDFPRITYDDALALANAGRRQRRQPRLDWGDDLQPVDEHAVLEASRTNDQLLPTIVTLFPAQLKFFNMKLDHRDRRRVLCADVLLPYAGEAIGAAVREDDYETLVRRLAESPMLHALTVRNLASIAEFDPYLRLIRDNATPTHAGYGIGLDRLLQFIARGTDIRTMSVASLLGEGAQ